MPCKKCLGDGCSKRPTFGFENRKPLYCRKHKEPGATDVMNVKCAFEGCPKQPNYNFPSEKKALFCVVHKELGMIDVKNPKCLHDGCPYQPAYGHIGEQPRYCTTHKEDNMINLKIKPCLKCDVVPNFGFTGRKALYCMTHALPGMRNLLSVKCVQEGCSVQANYPKFKGYCARCFMFNNPDAPMTYNYKIKERHVDEFLRQNYPNEEFTNDTRIEGGCSKRRPDWFFECYTHSVIVECDENQHQDYDSTCEIQRINELYTDLAYRPIVFIRFNPDDYIIKGKKIASSFRYHGTTGSPIVNNKKEWNNRLEKLKEQIDYHKKTVPKDMISIVSLFYDEN